MAYPILNELRLKYFKKQIKMSYHAICTEKPILAGHSKIDKTKTCIKR